MFRNSDLDILNWDPDPLRSRMDGSLERDDFPTFHHGTRPKTNVLSQGVEVDERQEDVARRPGPTDGKVRRVVNGGAVHRLTGVAVLVVRLTDTPSSVPIHWSWVDRCRRPLPTRTWRHRRRTLLLIVSGSQVRKVNTSLK